MRSFLANVGLAVLATLLALVGAEVAMQILYGDAGYEKSPGPNSEYRMDGLEFKTVIRTNSLNMRDGEIHPRREGEYRIAFLGDSFTFGLGVNVEERWPDLLAGSLTQGGRPIYGINAGGRGKYSREQFEFFREHADLFDPDLVLVQVFTGNDFVDALRRLRQAHPRAGADEVERERDDRFRPIRYLLRDRPIYLLELAWHALLRFDAVHDLLFRLNLRYSNRAILLREYPELEQQQAAEVLGGLAAIHDWTRSHGVRMAVIVVPDKIQVWQRELLNPERYDYAKPDRVVRDFCAARDIPVLDFLELYDGMPMEERKAYYYARDLHWNPEGHQHAAVEVARFLQSLDPEFTPATPALAGSR
jgi:hypothetical protein